MSDVSIDELSAYLEGDLDDPSRARVEAAVDRDPALRAELDELRALVGDLGSLPSMEAPDGLLDRVMVEVADLPIPGSSDGAGPALRLVADRPDEAPPRVAWWIKGPASAALAALLVVGFGVWLIGRQSGPAAPPAVAELEPSAPAPVAVPAMTGAADSGDALVAADRAEEVRRRLRARALADASRLREVRPEPTAVVARGTLDPRPARPRPARRSPKTPQEPPAEGVFVAEFERHEAPAEDLEVAAAEELTPASGAPADRLEEVSFGAAPHVAAHGGGATLDLAGGDRAALVAALRARGWSVSPAGAGFQVTIPEGQETQLVGLLREHGTLTIESPMRSMRDGKSRLIVTLR